MAGAHTDAYRGEELGATDRRQGGATGLGGEDWVGGHGECLEAASRGREVSRRREARQPRLSPHMSGERQTRLSPHMSGDIVLRASSPRWRWPAAGDKRPPTLLTRGEAALPGGNGDNASVCSQEARAKPRGWGYLMRLSGGDCVSSPAGAPLEGAGAQSLEEAHDPQAPDALPRAPQAPLGCAQVPAPPPLCRDSAPPSGSLEGFPADVLFRILCLLPRASWPSARGVCRSWRDAIGSGDMVRQRRALGVSEAWVFQVEWMFPRGRTSLALLWALDPAAHRWYALGCLPPMHGVSHTSHVCEFGRYAVFLGGNARRGGAAGLNPGACVWRYNLVTGHARRLPDMLQARVGCCSAVVGGRLLVAGGTGENDVALRAAEAFDPALRRWVRLPDLSVARRHCVGFELGGRFWVLSLGAPSESMSRSAEVYDPASQAWTLIPHMLPQGLGGRLSTRVALVGGRLVLTSHVRQCQHRVLVYDESHNVWHQIGQLPVSGFQGYGVVGLPKAQGLEPSLLVEGGIESSAEERACTHQVLQRTPYVSHFLPFRPLEEQWKPDPKGMESAGAARRCHHCIVSSL